MKTQHLTVRRPAMGILAAAAACLLATGLTAQGAPIDPDAKNVVNLGTTYTPAGANYTITAVQGIDAANPLGIGGASPQVNQNFEFTGSIAVSYQNSSGGLSADAISLYNNGTTSGIQSNGLRFQYNSQVTASSVTVTLQDFDTKSAAWGASQKAEPAITLFGANGAVLGTATPAQILASNPTFSTTNDGTFNINLGSLLGAMGQSSNTAIGGYLLSAANFSGETFQGSTTDDGYEFVSAGNGTPVNPPPSVPESSAFLPLLLVLGVAIGGPAIRRRLLAA